MTPIKDKATDRPPNTPPILISGRNGSYRELLAPVASGNFQILQANPRRTSFAIYARGSAISLRPHSKMVSGAEGFAIDFSIVFMFIASLWTHGSAIQDAWYAFNSNINETFWIFEAFDDTVP